MYSRPLGIALDYAHALICAVSDKRDMVTQLEAL